MADTKSNPFVDQILDKAADTKIFPDVNKDLKKGDTPVTVEEAVAKMVVDAVKGDHVSELLKKGKDTKFRVEFTVSHTDPQKDVKHYEDYTLNELIKLNVLKLDREVAAFPRKGVPSTEHLSSLTKAMFLEPPVLASIDEHKGNIIPVIDNRILGIAGSYNAHKQNIPDAVKAKFSLDEPDFPPKHKPISGPDDRAVKDEKKVSIVMAEADRGDLGGLPTIVPGGKGGSRRI